MSKYSDESNSFARILRGEIPAFKCMKMPTPSRLWTSCRKFVGMYW